MPLPKVSVIMPAYNQGRYIAEAMQSVLNQTYADWELIIVDDGSTDSTAGEVARFDDTRLRYIRQPHQGVSAARNVAIATSSGEYLAFLDADDIYHPGKLEAHVFRLNLTSEIGLTYGWRIEIDQQGKPLRVHRPPIEISLKTLVLGFPFAPSDIVVRRGWIERVGGFDQSLEINEDRDLFIRLALAGCQFTGLDRLLVYRRYHGDRVFQNLTAKLDDRLRVLVRIFNDPRCPVETRAVRDLAHRNLYLEQTYQASVANEPIMAQAYFREALRFDPSLRESNVDEVLQSLVEAATRDGGEHEARLRSVFAQLLSELPCLSRYSDWAVACGYLHRGAREVMWNRIDIGHRHFARAIALGAQLDERFFRLFRYQLLKYEAAFGPEAAETFLRNLSPLLKRVGSRTDVRRLMGWYAMSRASQHCRTGEYKRVPREVIRAMANDPKYVARRFSDSIRSWLGGLSDPGGDDTK